MNILYLSHEGGLNGAPKSLLEYLTVIKTKEVSPIVVVPGNGRLSKALKEKNIRMEIIPFQQCVSVDKDAIEQTISYVACNLKAVISLCKLICKENIELVHSNSAAVDVGAIAAYLCGIPHVWHLREYLEEDFGFKFRTPQITLGLLRKSNCRISIAEGIKQKYKETYHISTTRIYNGVNIENYYCEHQAKKTNEKQVNLLIAGAISQGKGQWDAIRAVEMLHNQGVNVNLTVVGDGAPVYVNILRRYVREHGLLECISFQKYTNDLQSLRLQSDMVLTCSRMEAFGRVTAEAMMAGRIVIGANSGGTKDLIGEHEERGYLYTFDRPQELADKILYVINHPEEKEKKEKDAQRFIVKLTDLDSYTDKILRIYNKILDKSKDTEVNK